MTVMHTIGQLVDVTALQAENDRLRESEGDLVDINVYYRNLAIHYGAPPDEMLNEFDRYLCETWTEDPSKITGFTPEDARREAREQWLGPRTPKPPVPPTIPTS